MISDQLNAHASITTAGEISGRPKRDRNRHRKENKPSRVGTTRLVVLGEERVAELISTTAVYRITQILVTYSYIIHVISGDIYIWPLTSSR